jgi:hypothetical protein
VVLGEVGEQGQLEMDRVAAMQRQRVGGDLHHAGRVSGSQHSPEGRLQVDRLRGRPLDLLLDPADDLPHRAEHSALDPRRLENRANQERGGRLPVRPGDPDHPQLRARIGKESSRQRSHRSPCVGNHHLRHGQIQLPLNHQRHSPSLDSGRGELMPIDLLTRHAKKQRSGPNFSAVISKRLDLDGTVSHDPAP